VFHARLLRVHADLYLIARELQVRQNYGVTVDRAFKPTSNARLAATFGETKRFADALRKFDKQCSAHLQGVKGAAVRSSPTHHGRQAVHIVRSHPAGCSLATAETTWDCA
jgi:hypothetical protein